MEPLTPNECRVLGVLVEKAQTVPGQYPMTLNALVTGSNQRNNRSPVLALDEDDVLDALDRLRGRGLVCEAMLSGSRVAKYKHDAREGLGVETSALVVLVELLLRGPQTPGELRTRAGRMHPLDSVEAVLGILQGLAERDPPLARELPPEPGARARRWQQLITPDLHPLGPAGGTPSTTSAPSASPPPSAPAPPADDGLRARVEALEARVARLEAMVAGSGGSSA